MKNLKQFLGDIGIKGHLKKFLGGIGIKGHVYAFFALLFLYFFVTKAIKWYFEPLAYSLPDDRAYWGTFGDFIGGLLNPIFAFLSFLALLYTIYLQREELKETRKFQEKERFESTFFVLLDQHNKVLEDINETPSPIPVSIPNVGQSRIAYTPQSSIVSKVFQTLDEKSKNPYPYDEFNLKVANNIVKKQNLCGHYFRVLYQLLKFVAINIPDSEIKSFDDFKKNEKQLPLAHNEKMYSNMVRAFLEGDLLLLLAINAYCENSDDDYWGYKLLIERYAFF